MRLVIAFVLALSAAVGAPEARAQQADPLSAAFKSMYDGIKINVLEMADNMPEAKYGFHPTEGVRTFGEMLAHVGDRHYRYCAMAKGERSPIAEDELFKTKKTPADQKQALKDSYAYCDAAFGAMTDKRAMEPLSLFGQQTIIARALLQVIAHDNEEYGNLIPYLRMNGLVPPSTERQQRAKPPGQH